MKVPDKIWVTPSEMTELLSEKRHVYDIAYIRKDTLLELTKEIKRICKGAEPIEKAYQTVIDKIESL